MIIDYINSHHAQFWIAAGFVLMAAELLLFGFSTIVLLFAGIGALVTGLLMLSGVLPETWIAGVSCFGILAGVSSVLMWKPLRNMQEAATPGAGQGSDLLGLEFVLAGDIDRTISTTHAFSGVHWRVELDASSPVESIAAGSRVKVTAVEAGIFRVTPAG